MLWWLYNSGSGYGFSSFFRALHSWHCNILNLAGYAVLVFCSQTIREAFQIIDEVLADLNFVHGPDQASICGFGCALSHTVPWSHFIELSGASIIHLRPYRTCFTRLVPCNVSVLRVPACPSGCFTCMVTCGAGTELSLSLMVRSVIVRIFHVAMLQ